MLAVILAATVVVGDSKVILIVALVVIVAVVVFGIMLISVEMVDSVVDREVAEVVASEVFSADCVALGVSVCKAVGVLVTPVFEVFVCVDVTTPLVLKLVDVAISVKVVVITIAVLVAVIEC